MSTLRYATKAHHIHSALNVVEPDSRSNLISKLKEEICSLRYLVASFSTPKPSCSSSCSSLESTQTASSINVYCSSSVLQVLSNLVVFPPFSQTMVADNSQRKTVYKCKKMLQEVVWSALWSFMIKISVSLGFLF